MIPTPFINPTTFPAAKFANIGIIVNLIIPLLMVGAAIIFLIMLIRGAFYFIMGEGKPEEIAKATKTIMFAVIGLVIVIAAFLIIKLIGIIFNIQLSSLI